MMTRLWKRWLNRGQKRPQSNRARLSLERLEDRTVPSAFTAGNIAVLDLAAASTNTTGSILELNPSTGALVQTIDIASTGNNAIRFSDSGTSSFLSDTNDGTLLAFSAYNTSTTSGNLASLNPRAVGTLNGSGTFNLATTYNVSSADLTAGNQTRSATSLDDMNWFITDKGGLYTNGATTPSLTTNILDARAFGDVVYVSSTKATAGVSTVSSPTAATLGGLPGLPADGSIQDFYLIQSGSNGSTYDILYTLDQNSGNATINKFSLVSGSWVSNGSYTFAANGEAMIAENDGGGGAYLFVTTTNGTANNSLARLTDAAGYNTAINISTANNVALYTDTNSDLLKGLAFVPAASPTAPTVDSPTSANVGISSATLGGAVTSTGSPGAISYGVVYSLTSVNPDPTIGGAGVTQVPGSGTPVFSPFTVSATGLQGTSGYSYAAYATNGAGTTYSSVATFTTQSSNPPTVDMPTDASITSSSAVLGGTVESNGGATITKTGVVYALTSANGNPQIGGAGVTEVDANPLVASGAFTVSATGLTSGAGYTFEAFATNSSGTTYTTATSFTTLAAPTVNTPTFTDVTSTSATLGGDVASDGGSTVTKTGIVYALTSANGNPQIGGAGVTEVDTGSPIDSGAFTVPVTGLTPGAAYTFEAFATNSIAATYSAATPFTTAAPGVIAAWTFPTTAGAGDNSPAPTYGAGTATTLGMTNSYNGGNTASDDVLATAGTANTNFSENLWRVRGTPNNGWATYQNGAGAPEYSQGIELDASTVGYSNIVFSFDWYSTTQGIRDLQVQYNTGSGWVNYQGPSPTGTFVTGGNDYYNSLLSPVNPTIHIDLSGVAAANNNPDLGIRLVSAFDSTGTLVNSMGVPDEYASAASTAGDIIPYNNSSGNWRFGNLTFSAGVATTTTVTANPPGGDSPGQNVTFTATVTPASGAQYPSGAVAFFDGATQIGATQTVSQVGSTNVGTASITLSTLAPGVHGDITAQYTPASGNGLIASGSSMNLVAGDPTDNPISYTINAPQATGVDVSPVVGEPFTGVVATFSDGTYTDPTGFSATITWTTGQTTSGVIAFTGAKNETNINGQIVPVSLFTVTGTYTYTTAGTYPISVLITDPNGNTATVAPTARVAYPPLVVTDVATINTTYGANLTGQTVATFTDPGLVANLTALGISDPTTQFTASINWGDGSPAVAGVISYNSTTQIFSVVGSHTYALAGPYSISVAVTPLTVSVERIDSSDPNGLNEVGDENGNGLTDSPSPDFIDQFVTDPGNSTLQNSLYTFSLPTVAATGGNEALTNSSYSVSEGELTLSTNGEYLVTGGYNDTVSLYAPQQTFSPASVINRVIGTINGAGVINTTTDLTDAYTGDNFRGVVSTDGTQFWTAGHSGDGTSDYVHYATLGATTSTILTGPSNTPYNPENINTVEIFNGQLYEGVRSAGGAAAPAGIYLIGNAGAGLPTTAGQPETLLIQVPQTNPLDITSSDKPMDPFGFYMANLNDGNPTDPISGENVAYVADAEMGIARYDYSQTTGETSPQWNFSYYIDSTGSFKDSVYTVDPATGQVTPTSSFNSTNPIPASNPNADPTKAGGVRELTGRVVNGQVQLFAVTGFGTGSEPNPGESLIEVTDTGANAGFTTLATDPAASASELTGVAFTPTQTVTSAVNVAQAATSTMLTSSVNPAVYGQPITFTATVTNTSGSGAVPVGSIQFKVDGANFGAAVPVNASGQAVSSAVSFLTGASHTVEAVYNPSTNFVGSNKSLTQVVQTVAVEPDPSNPALTDLFIGSPGANSNDHVQVSPVGRNDTGSTGVKVQTRLNGVNAQTTYSRSIFTIYIFLQGGNDNVQLANSLTINTVVTAGNGNDNIQLGKGNNTVTLGNGNDTVLAGDGSNTVMAGGGNDFVLLGNGAGDRVELGSGNDIVLLGNGGNQVVTLGNGNDLVLAGDGGNDHVTLGNGNDIVLLGRGNNQVVTLGNGNDLVLLGDGGDDAVTLGSGNDDVQIGDGSDNTVFLPAAGNRHAHVKFGKGKNNTIITQ